MQDTVYALACDWTELKTPILAQRASVVSVQRGGGGARSHGVSVAPPVFTKVQSGGSPAYWSMNKSTTSCALDFCRTSNGGQATTPMLRQRPGQHTSWSLQTGLIGFHYNCNGTSFGRQLLPDPISVLRTGLQYRRICSCSLAPCQTKSTMDNFDPLHFGQDYMILPSEESQPNARSSNVICESGKIMGVLFRVPLTPVAQLRATQALTNLLCLERVMNKT